MKPFHLSILVLAIAALALSGPALAWKGGIAQGIQPIDEVLERAESGDFVSVQGEVRHVRTGNGGVIVVTLEDDTGEVYLVVPNHLRRAFGGGKATGGSGPGGIRPQVGRKVMVMGKWGHAPMSSTKWGIRVQKAERIED